MTTPVYPNQISLLDIANPEPELLIQPVELIQEPEVIKEPKELIELRRLWDAGELGMTEEMYNLHAQALMTWWVETGSSQQEPEEEIKEPVEVIQEPEEVIDLRRMWLAGELDKLDISEEMYIREIESLMKRWIETGSKSNEQIKFQRILYEPKIIPSKIIEEPVIVEILQPVEVIQEPEEVIEEPEKYTDEEKIIIDILEDCTKNYTGEGETTELQELQRLWDAGISIISEEIYISLTKKLSGN